MSKLAPADRFIDLSDYGRPLANYAATKLRNSPITPIHLTYLFGVSGLLGIYFLLYGHFLIAGIFLLLKSVIDAADGELSRVKNTPSHSGRYLDSIFDILLNLLVLLAICQYTSGNIWLALAAFLAVQLQGTLYNYYYVILRSKSKGADGTSKIFERKPPSALPGENQRTVNTLFWIFYALYGVFDRAVYWMDPGALRAQTFPNWFMTLLSIYGLGFQLLLIAILLSANLIGSIIPFFIGYSVLFLVFIPLRRWVG
ncbi:CDP-alcohol phosphatidyltransferase family protein [Lunatibacter salilacus]|uniref:CDP-alcohol phosphatidyltransferase family protein n=1 Tax=Lunatibacter salilacus TaxID=2483804 RepID=UPI00131BF870|nr:CDP-alcohol phosphatidyltransferase family protein [Lunatibacter salilacus]